MRIQNRLRSPADVRNVRWGWEIYIMNIVIRPITKHVRGWYKCPLRALSHLACHGSADSLLLLHEAWSRTSTTLPLRFETRPSRDVKDSEKQKRMDGCRDKHVSNEQRGAVCGPRPSFSKTLCLSDSVPQPVSWMDLKPDSRWLTPSRLCTRSSTTNPDSSPCSSTSTSPSERTARVDRLVCASVRIHVYSPTLLQIFIGYLRTSSVSTPERDWIECHKKYNDATDRKSNEVRHERRTRRKEKHRMERGGIRFLHSTL